LRAQFRPPTERVSQLSCSALDPGWMDEVDRSAAVFIVIQGLLICLEPDAVQDLFSAIVRRFSGTKMVLDIAPRRMSEITVQGREHVGEYQIPPMLWASGQERSRGDVAAAGSKVDSGEARESKSRPFFIEKLLDRALARRRRANSIFHIVA
jgi:O-methyltransferase involved in polyketide biosynthesis